MEKKALIFDLYATLIDIWTDQTKPELWKDMAALYRVYGAVYTPDELRNEFQRLCHEKELKLGGEWPEIDISEVFSELLRKDREVSVPATEGFTHMAANVFRIISRNRFGLMPNALMALIVLKAAGHKIFLLSNAQSIFTVPEMEAMGIYGLFDKIYISSDHGVRKPDPEFMRILLREQNLKPEDAIMIGNDFDSDMRVAVSCGVRGILLNSSNYSDEYIAERLKYFPHNSIKIINDLSELLI